MPTAGEPSERVTVPDTAYRLSPLSASDGSGGPEGGSFVCSTATGSRLGDSGADGWLCGTAATGVQRPGAGCGPTVGPIPWSPSGPAAAPGVLSLVIGMPRSLAH